ncbi:MAG: ABC transporter substrate-binding protein [Rhodospirillales bacterium]|nr:MAG: ABC transporter substrate-binding protein [Rhodospirillales bacterium]
MDDSRMRAFVEAYRKEFGGDPDAFAVAEYDAVSMLAAAVAEIARESGVDKVTGDAVRAKLGAMRWRGLAMEYKSDGKGNMAHAAMVVCYGGASRVPDIAARYVPAS